MTTVIFLAIEENFRKGKEEVESQTGFGFLSRFLPLVYIMLIMPYKERATWTMTPTCKTASLRLT